MEEKRKINFMLYGEGTFLNKGCEAIVNTTIKKIKKTCDGEIILSTNDYQYDSKYYNDIITKYVQQYYLDKDLSEEERKKIEYYKTIPFDYTNFEKIYKKDCIKEIENVDICLSVGGDNYCYGEPYWLYTINKCIKEKGKKNVFWCTSIYENIESDEMIRDLKTYDVVVTRESLTYNALAKFMDKDRLMLTPDTAFSLEKKETSLPKIFKKYKKVVGINISPLISNYTTKKDNIANSIKTLIEYILEDNDTGVILIPHVYIETNRDLDALAKVKEIFKDNDRVEILDDRIYDCEEIKYVISKCKYLVAARTHASIAGYSTIVPTLVIGYSVKSKGIALDLFGEYENYVIPVDEMTPEILLKKFKFIQDNEEEIKRILKEKMVIYKKKADNQLVELLDRLEYLDKKHITDICKCTGCMACYNICPSGAIEVVENDKGFLYTKINSEKCINCGLCKKVCPANKAYKNVYEKPEFYAVVNNKEDERINSSSGGIVGCISKEILKNKGVVYGVALENKEAKHIRVDKEKDIYKIMGSKYVQSIIGDIYSKVKTDLENNLKVLFTGTPCQIEGLKSYLNKEYKNLITLAIICHGVPSPKVLKKHINEKEKKRKEKIKNISFRNKKFGWHKWSVSYEYENGEIEIIPFTKDYFMQGFLRNYYLRESCYNCQMRFEKKNSADIMVGDFWGIEEVLPEIDDDKGVSAVIVNSQIGLELFEKIKNKVKYEKTTFNDILKGNPVLISSVKYTKNEEKFYDLINDYSMEMIINSLKGINSDDEINKMRDEIKTLNSQIKDLLEAKKYFLGQIELRDIQLEQKENLIREKEGLIQERDSEIHKIYYSRRWKYTSKIANVFHKIKKH